MIGGVFLITLLIVSIITVRISDMILDSRIGALDRTLGFLFGLGRGLIIVVVAFLFFAWLVPAQAARRRPQRQVARGAATRPATGCRPCCRRTWITIFPVVQETPEGRRAGHAGRAARPAFRYQCAGRHRLGARAGYPSSDRTDMRQLIDATKQRDQAMDG